MTAWHPDATKNVFPSAGSYVTAGKKICWHTTETKGLPAYNGTQPHFTLNPRTGDLWQHQSINEAAKALAHTVAPETNRAQCVQVELICYSSESVAKSVGGLAVPDLTDADYENIWDLARWIEHNFGVKRQSSVSFKHYPESAGVANGVRLGAAAWMKYEGHLGHQHVPGGNVHGDPSSLDIKRILAKEEVTRWGVSFKNQKGERVESSTGDPAAWAHQHPGAYQRGTVRIIPKRG